MKLLFWLLVILLVWWAFQRTKKSTPPSAGTQSTAEPQDMARCAQCGIHLPQSEAVRGEKGLYCSTEHRTAAQDRNPA
jgi:uncharacterized protein